MANRLENVFVEAYLSGWLPLPESALQALLNACVSGYYQTGKRLDRMPAKWAGDRAEVLPCDGNRLLSTHYDLPARLFEHFLGRTMKYSMALWEDGAGDLDSAQEAMMADLCRKIEMRDGLSVLDVGCGFGSFASFVLTHFPRSPVVGVTLSDTQYRYMVEKQRQPGHPLNTSRFTCIKADFSRASLPETFDRVVSVGVFEHLSNLKLALAAIRRRVRDNGACLVHFVVYTELIERFADYDMSDTFMRRYIFPDSRFWHDRELFKFQDDFAIERYWFMNGGNYRRTLEAWRRNFQANWNAIRAIRGDGDRFYRTWNYYFRFTQALFRARGGRQVGNGQYLLRPR